MWFLNNLSCLWITVDPWPAWGLWLLTPHTDKSLCLTFDSPQTLLIAYYWWEALPITQSINTHFVCHMYYILYSYNSISWRKENVISNIVKKKYIYSSVLYVSKKNLLIGGPMYFELMSFKGQCTVIWHLHISSYRSIYS